MYLRIKLANCKTENVLVDFILNLIKLNKLIVCIHENNYRFSQNIAALYPEVILNLQIEDINRSEKSKFCISMKFCDFKNQRYFLEGCFYLINIPTKYLAKLLLVY